MDTEQELLIFHLKRRMLYQKDLILFCLKVSEVI